MLYFADKIKPPTELESSIINQLNKFNQSLEDGLHTLSYLPLPKNTLGNLRRAGRLLWDVVQDIDIHSDECNILITSGLGTYWHRNPYCQPEQPPPLPDFPPEEIFIPSPIPTAKCCLYLVSISGGTRENYNNNASAVWGEVYGLLHVYHTHDSYYRQGEITDDVDVFIICHRPATLSESFGTFNSYPTGGIEECLLNLPDRGNRSLIWSESTSRYPGEPQYKPVFEISKIDSWRCDFSPIPPVPKPPPPPPPPKMECCPGQKNNDKLLKLILKRIGEPKQVQIFDEDLARAGAQKSSKTPQSLNDFFKLAVERIEIANRIIGIENFPIQVPDTMIEPYKEGPFAKIFKFIDGEKKIKINTIAEFIVWMSKQDSAVLGEFHQVIEMETEVKGKNATIVLPNVAESLKEIVLLTAQMAKQNNIQTELIFKIAAELVATRAVATKGTSISQDIQDYLDYPTDTKKAKIKTAVSLPKFTTNKDGIPIATSQSENPKAFLKPGEVEYTYDDWTGSNSLHDQLLDLMQLAAMLRAIYFQRTDEG